MGAQKLTEVAIGSTPTENTHFLVTQPETVNNETMEAVRRPTSGSIKELIADGLIAPKFSDQSSYAAGSYVLKNGVLYRFTSDHPAGAWTGTDAEVVTVGEELTDLKAYLKIPENIGGSSAGNLAIDYRTGEANGSTNQTHTDYVDLTGITSIVYTRITTTSTSPYTGMAFYDVNKVYISGQRCVVGASKYGYEVTELNVPSAAKYARFSISKDLDGFFVNTKEAYENSLSNRVGKLESDFESISSDVSVLQADISGLDIVNIDDITWELGFALTATGYTSTAANSAISPFLPVKNEVYTRSGSATDAEENSYSLWFHQYAGNDPSTWISRTSVSVGDSITLNESCKYFRIGYVKIKGSARPAITTEDIENTFGLYYKTTMQSITERINVLENYHPSYTGKKLSILGDSISTFASTSEKTDGKASEGCITNYPGNPVQYSNSDVTNVNSTWWGQVLEQFNMTLGINESWAGSCIGYNSSQTSSGKYTVDNCLCSQARIGHLGENGTPDIIIVFGGTNDINHHRVGTTDTMRYAVGELDSEHNPYDYDNFPMITETYYGSITTMLLRIQHTYPNAVILMLLPYFCTSTHTSSGDRATPYDQNEWSKAAIDVCEYLGVEYLDLRTIINLYDVPSLLFDGLHPKANGMAAIAKAVIHKLNNML